jgi:hypothetical protein
VKTPARTPFRESFTWIYGLALLVTVASVDTGVVPYLTTLINNLFGTSFDGTKHATILVITVALIVVQTLLHTVGAKVMGLVARMGAYVETVGTFGVAIALGIAGFHHGLGFLFTTHGAAHAASNPLGVDFHGNWLRRGAPSCYESGVFAGRTPGAARLDPHRLTRHLRGASPRNAVLSCENAGRWGAKAGRLSGERDPRSPVCGSVTKWRLPGVAVPLPG